MTKPFCIYRKTSCISRTKSQNLNVSCILLQLSLLNPLKPGVKLTMKMYIWVINNFIAWWGATYIRGFTVNFPSLKILTYSWMRLVVYIMAQHLFGTHVLYNLWRQSDVYIHNWTGSSLVQVMVCHIFGGKFIQENLFENVWYSGHFISTSVC